MRCHASRNIPKASKIQTPLYSGHAAVVPMVSGLEGLHCSHFMLPNCFLIKCNALVIGANTASNFCCALFRICHWRSKLVEDCFSHPISSSRGSRDRHFTIPVEALFSFHLDVYIASFTNSFPVPLAFTAPMAGQEGRSNISSIAIHLNVGMVSFYLYFCPDGN